MSRYRMSGPNVYECSDGYSVEVLGRTGLLYREHDRSLFVDSEVLALPAGILVYRDSIRRWQSPPGESEVSEAERDRIVGNVLAALRSQGIDVQVM